MCADLLPLTLYVHLPWCVRKCPYCDFNSHQLTRGEPPAKYVDALLRDLDADLELVPGRLLTSIFLGGGTPSLFPAAAVNRLLDGIRQRVTLKPEAEITIEANPGATDAGSFAGYLTSGINRLSLGVQSFRDPMLLRIGRIHDAAAAAKAFAAARTAGFTNINIDLMFGLPGDSAAGAERDLQTALNLQPEHLSWYQLTIEPQTAFGRQPPRLPDSDTIALIQETGAGLLSAYGYRQYEISAYCRAGRESVHNLNYWLFGDYLGIGAGAHGKITGAAGTITRTTKRTNPASYMRYSGSSDVGSRREIDSTADRTLEFMMNALRLVDGFTVETFEQRTRVSAVSLSPRLVEARARGLLTVEGERIRASALGRRFLNDLLLLFVATDSEAAVMIRSGS